MTKQVSDNLTYNGESYTIIGFSEEDPYYSFDFDVNPVSASTACWRGFYCGYEVKEYRLYFEHYIVNHSNDNKTASEEPPAPINEVAANLSSSDFIGKWQYSNIDLFIDNYSGGILIANNLSKEARSSPIQRLSDYGNMYELIFSFGVLLDSYDMKEAIAEVKKRNQDFPSSLRTIGEISDWKRDNEQCLKNSLKKPYPNL